MSDLAVVRIYVQDEALASQPAHVVREKLEKRFRGLIAEAKATLDPNATYEPGRSLREWKPYEV